MEKQINDIEFLSTKEVAQYLGCSLPVARATMRSKSFPLIKIGTNLKVMKSAFIEWASERRV